MSLLDAAEKFASLDRSQIVLDAQRCLHSQDQYSDCAACFNICPVDAISAGKPPRFNSDLCKSCLACLPACPVGAYHADDDVANLLNCATHVEDQSVELLCGLHPHPESGTASESIGIKIRGCLAGLGTGAYLTLSALGLKRILPRTDACRACKWQILSPEIDCQVERANRFLSSWGRADAVTCVNEIVTPVERILWSAKNPPVSRRDLFRMMARQGQVAMARAMENGMTSSKRQPGRDRMRLLSALQHLPSAQPAASDNCFKDFNFTTLTISEFCNACGTCGRACPTEALKFEKNETEMTFSISFSPQKCIGCDLCDHVCQPNAITLNHAPIFEQVFGEKEPVVAESGILVHCVSCKTLMAKHEGLKICQLCEYRRKHPFGSMMPRKPRKESHS